MKGLKILITGGCGFIGCNAAVRFHELGHKITLLDNLSRPCTDLNLEWLRDFTRFQDPVPERLKEFDQFNDRQMVDPATGF